MDYYLSHYGIKNQRHGIRRFQNEDGSLTPAGVERYRRMVQDNRKSGVELQNKEKEMQSNETKRQLQTAAAKAKLTATNYNPLSDNIDKRLADVKYKATLGKIALSRAADFMSYGISSVKYQIGIKKTRNFMEKLMNNSSNRSLTGKQIFEAGTKGRSMKKSKKK